MGISAWDANAERRDDSTIIDPRQLVKDANVLQVHIAFAETEGESVARRDPGYTKVRCGHEALA